MAPDVTNLPTRYVPMVAGNGCCTECGALVGDRAAHDDWHAGEIRALAALREFAAMLAELGGLG